MASYTQLVYDAVGHLAMCSDCGVAVVSQTKHDEWHSKMEARNDRPTLVRPSPVGDPPEPPHRSVSSW